MLFDLLCLLAFVLLATISTAFTHNILMIAVDDLRTELNLGYGMNEVFTPNLDKLVVSQGTVTFLNAYCQMAVCSPSRNSFMSGRRPDHTRVWTFLDSFRNISVGANWTTMPEYFKNHGYRTTAAGKLFHPGSPAQNDFPTSWTQDASYPAYWGNGGTIGDASSCDSNVNFPSQDWTVNSICTAKNDSAALNDDDDASAAQSGQLVEYSC